MVLAGRPCVTYRGGSVLARLLDCAVALGLVMSARVLSSRAGTLSDGRVRPDPRLTRDARVRWEDVDYFEAYDDPRRADIRVVVLDTTRAALVEKRRSGRVVRAGSRRARGPTRSSCALDDRARCGILTAPEKQARRSMRRSDVAMPDEAARREGSRAARKRVRQFARRTARAGGISPERTARSTGQTASRPWARATGHRSARTSCAPEAERADPGIRALLRRTGCEPDAVLRRVRAPVAHDIPSVRDRPSFGGTYVVFTLTRVVNVRPPANTACGDGGAACVQRAVRRSSG